MPPPAPAQPRVCSTWGQTPCLLPPAGSTPSNACLPPSLLLNSQQGVSWMGDTLTAPSPVCRTDGGRPGRLDGHSGEPHSQRPVLWGGDRRKGRGWQQESSPAKEESNPLAPACPRELQPLQQLPWGSIAARLARDARRQHTPAKADGDARLKEFHELIPTRNGFLPLSARTKQSGSRA